MATSIDQLNYYDPLIQSSKDKMSEAWISNMSAFIQTLQGYLSQFGMFIPIVTTAQRGTIQSPVEGQLIYNVDATVGPPRSADIQVWQVKAGVGAWRSITTVP
jgi:hypothetical protein